MGTPCSDVVAGAIGFKLFRTSHTAQCGTHDSDMLLSLSRRRGEYDP